MKKLFKYKFRKYASKFLILFYLFALGIPAHAGGFANKGWANSGGGGANDVAITPTTVTTDSVMTNKIKPSSGNKTTVGNPGDSLYTPHLVTDTANITRATVSVLIVEEDSALWSLIDSGGEYTAGAGTYWRDPWTFGDSVAFSGMVSLNDSVDGTPIFKDNASFIRRVVTDSVIANTANGAISIPKIATDTVTTYTTFKDTVELNAGKMYLGAKTNNDYYALVGGNKFYFYDNGSLGGFVGNYFNAGARLETPLIESNSGQLIHDPNDGGANANVFGMSGDADTNYFATDAVNRLTSMESNSNNLITVNDTMQLSDGIRFTANQVTSDIFENGSTDTAIITINGNDYYMLPRP